MNEAKGIEGLSELRKSYEYTLERVGADSASGSLWQEYINFLQAPRAGTPAYQALFSGGLPGQEETQRILWLRYSNIYCCTGSGLLPSSSRTQH